MRMHASLRLLSLLSLSSLAAVSLAQQPASPAAPLTSAATTQADPCKPRVAPPRRDPHSPGFVNAVEIADGHVPPADRDGNYVLGPTHLPAPETSSRPGVP